MLEAGPVVRWFSLLRGTDIAEVGRQEHLARRADNRLAAVGVSAPNGSALIAGTYRAAPLGIDIDQARRRVSAAA